MSLQHLTVTQIYMEDVVSLAGEIYLSLLGWSVEKVKKKKAEKDRWCEIKRNSKGRSKIDRGRKEEKD